MPVTWTYSGHFVDGRKTSEPHFSGGPKVLGTPGTRIWVAQEMKHSGYLYCEGHSERFTALHGEEKREEGVRGDTNADGKESTCQ